MICTKTAKRYCCEDVSLIENYEQAMADSKTWHCHHRRETTEGLTTEQLIETGLYYGRPASELIFLPVYEHLSSHNKGRKPWNKGVLGTDEFRKKMSEVTRGEKNPFYGKHHSDETKRKISVANTGRCPSEETRKKMSESRTGDKNGFFGKHHSEETRKRWSLTRSGKNNHTFGKLWYNNGLQEAHFLEGQQPDGWVRGRLKRQKKEQL